MHPVFAIILLILGTGGHVVLWVAIVNRLHAIHMNRSLLDTLTNLCGVALVSIPVLIGAILYTERDVAFQGPWDLTLRITWLIVTALALFFITSVINRVRSAWHSERRIGLTSNHTSTVDVRKRTDESLTAPGVPTFLANLPKNEILQPRFHEKRLLLPRFKSSREIKIAHLTDLHMSGRIAKRYFVEVVKEVNALNPDLVAITGDIVERAHCIDWIPDTLGQLRAAHGVYFILGNHDLRAGPDKVRAALVKAGLVDVGGRWLEIDVDGTPLVIAGNELPWFQPAADLTPCPPHNAGGQPPRMLLSHSPDQFVWAQEHEVDLMLAGHCHGGQVRFPLVGAVLAPSKYGTRYAAGVFTAEQTVMHVSRGTCGLAPFRWNCPPEVALLKIGGSAK